MRSGRFVDAKRLLDQVIPIIGGIISGTSDAKRSRSLFAAESSKTFIGEPYERVMAYYYRGVLYWMDGEYDNARACFKTGLFIDSDASTRQFSADYALLEYLDGLATQILGGDGSLNLKRSREVARLCYPPDYVVDFNVALFVDYGNGPTKYATGKYAEQLRFRSGVSDSDCAVLEMDGREVSLDPFDDVNFQASTRGGREMDYILDRKAHYKSETGEMADKLNRGETVTFNKSLFHNMFQFKATLTGNGFGEPIKSVSEHMKPAADVRCWNNLPQYLSFTTLKLNPGEHKVTVKFKSKKSGSYTGSEKGLVVNVREGLRSAYFISDK